MTIAIYNSGFHGDTLWSVPAARELARRANYDLVDFWLTRRASQTADLLRCQSFVRNVHIDDGDGFLRLRDRYSAAYSLDTQGLGEETLLDHYCRCVGLPRQGHWFELPHCAPLAPLPKPPFVVLAAKKVDGSEWMRAISDILYDFVARCPVPVVEVGCSNTALTVEAGAIDRTCQGFLEMARIIAKCRVFVGTISAPLVLADAFPEVHRIAVHDGAKWNLSRCTKSPLNHYPVYPTGEQLADMVGGML